MIPNIGPIELLIVAVIALLVIGPKKLPEAGRSLGRGMREFKDGISGGEPAEPAAVAPVAADRERTA